MSKKPYFPPQPHQQQQTVRHQGSQQVVIQGQIHTGPLPVPDDIAGYEKILPGAADRIIKMAEKEQEHRHGFHKRHQSNQVFLTLAGQVFAFTIGIGGIAGGIYLVKNDKSLAGFGVFFTSLAALVGVFFYSRSNPNKPAQKNQTPAQKNQTR